MNIGKFFHILPLMIFLSACSKNNDQWIVSESIDKMSGEKSTVASITKTHNGNEIKISVHNENKGYCALKIEAPEGVLQSAFNSVYSAIRIKSSDGKIKNGALMKASPNLWGTGVESGGFSALELQLQVDETLLVEGNSTLAEFWRKNPC